MKLNKIYLLLFICASICAFRGSAYAFDPSEEIFLERYTIIDGNTLEDDQGYLLRNGKYDVISSFVGGYQGFSQDVFEPISGRPIMIEEEFEDYKAAGVIPHWTRSKNDFYIGFIAEVIVSVEGGLDPNPIPVIQEQPLNQSVIEGQTAIFLVDASPAAYLSYQWLFNGRKIPGQTDSFLIIQVDRPNQAGNYSVESTTGGKNVVSKKAQLKIVLPVAITAEPKSQTMKEEHGAVFRVAANGSPPYRYQWYFNSVPISQATKSFYVLPHVKQTDAGSYSVTVSNQVSFATSSSATLSITQ